VPVVDQRVLLRCEQVWGQYQQVRSFSE
jgi:hypothetical protein